MVRLAYLGPPGTFSEQAALRYTSDARGLPFPSISAVAAAVVSGGADEGVLPIENSLEGAVTETLDILIEESDLAICYEVILSVDHCLLVRPNTEASQVTVIHSHPQALAQCRRYIDRSFPQIPVAAALSTAAAVKEAMKQKGAAAIGNRRAAHLFGAEVLATDLAMQGDNVTRFVVVSHRDHEPTGRDKTSVAFTFSMEDRPGQLVGTLQEFAVRGINLSKVESRPSKERLGTYVFLVDVDGHRHDPLVGAALEEIEGMCSSFRIFGSYPRYRQDG